MPVKNTWIKNNAHAYLAQYLAQAHSTNVYFLFSFQLATMWLIFDLSQFLNGEGNGTHSSTLAWKIHGRGRLVGCSPWGRKHTFTFHFHALEKEMATHSSVLAWRIPRTGEPGGLPSMGSHRVRHDWSDLAAAAFLYFKIVGCIWS